MKILALDPGVTTGYARGEIDDTGVMTIDSGQDQFSHFELYCNLVLAKPDQIVFESFEYRAKARAGLNLTPVELIGVIKLYCDQHSVPFHAQTAATGKGHFTDTKLKNSGAYKPGRPHGMDALRHLLQWYTFGPGYQYNLQGFRCL